MFICNFVRCAADMGMLNGTLLRKMHVLLSDVMREEKLPNDWKVAAILLIHKKEKN